MAATALGDTVEVQAGHTRLAQDPTERAGVNAAVGISPSWGPHVLPHVQPPGLAHAVQGLKGRWVLRVQDEAKRVLVENRERVQVMASLQPAARAHVAQLS